MLSYEDTMLKGKTEKILKKIVVTKKAALYLLPTVFILGTLILTALIAAGYHFYYWGKIYPGVKVAGISVGGLTIEKAEAKLKEQVKTPEAILLKNQSQDFVIPIETLEFRFDFKASVRDAFDLYKTSSKFNEFYKSFLTLREQPEVPLRFTYSKDKLDENLSVIAGQVAIEPIYPKLALVNKTIVVEKGKTGQDAEIEKLKSTLLSNLAYANFSPLIIQVKEIDPTLSDKEVEAVVTRAEKLLNKNLTISFEHSTFTYKEAEIINLLNPLGGYSDKNITLLTEKLAVSTNREPQNAVFRFEEGRVREFLPAKDGVEVDKVNLSQEIKNRLSELENSDVATITFELPVKRISPVVTTQEVNNLGINELLGRGESKYAGSIPSRIHNVGLAASKFNGVLIAPGETFSFNEIVGDVSSLTGYKQAYVILSGKTVLGDGGGVCQVSTTLFRAALNAGLPIVERRAHAYRVSYYEQGFPPGLDATVYTPTTDLKIKNDTPKHILIQTTNDPKNVHLVFEIYGTSDGRVATTTKPVVTSVSPPPEDLYTDDPTLPAGTVKQIDWKAWGAKVVFDYKVVRGDEVLIEKTFVSNYRPWQAKFLRGTGPVN